MDVGPLFVFLPFASRRCLGFWMMVLSLCSSFLFLGIVLALDVGSLFVFPLLFLGVVLALDVGPLFVFSPFCFWVLSQRWVLVLSLCSLHVGPLFVFLAFVSRHCLGFGC
jgi:hypothetical protein